MNGCLIIYCSEDLQPAKSDVSRSFPAIWFCFAWFLRKIPQVRLLNWFCTASLLITLAGLLLSGLAEAGKAEQGGIVRLGDGMVEILLVSIV